MRWNILENGYDAQQTRKHEIDILFLLQGNGNGVPGSWFVVVMTVYNDKT